MVSFSSAPVPVVSGMFFGVVECYWVYYIMLSVMMVASYQSKLASSYSLNYSYDYPLFLPHNIFLWNLSWNPSIWVEGNLLLKKVFSLILRSESEGSCHVSQKKRYTYNLLQPWITPQPRTYIHRAYIVVVRGLQCCCKDTAYIVPCYNLNKIKNTWKNPVHIVLYIGVILIFK